MPPHVKRWTSNGQAHVHTTTCDEGESKDACLARHQAAVAVFLGAFPEDPR